MRDPLHRIPVRYKLSAALVGVCLVAFAVGGYLVFGSEKSDLETEIRGRLALQSRACASALDAELRLLASRVRDFASDGYIRGHVESLLDGAGDAGRTATEAELRRHLESNKLPLVEAFTALDVFGPDGIPVMSTAPQTVAAVGAVMGQAGVEGADPGCAVFTQPGSDEPGLVISTPLRSVAGARALGRLVARVRPGAWIAAAFAGSGVREMQIDSLKVRLVDDRRGELSIAPELTSRDGPAPDSPLVRSGFGVRYELRPPPRARPPDEIASSTFPISMRGWSVEIERNISEDLSAVAGLKSRVLAAGLALAAAAALLAWFPMRFVARPLMRMQDAARRIAKGDFSAHVDVQTSDEIGELARSFNVMAAAVQERTSRLERAAADLTERQAELRREGDRLAAVISSMHDGLVVVDSDGRPVVANAAARPLLKLIENQDAAAGHHRCHETRARGGCGECLFDPEATPRNCIVDIDGGSYEIHTTRLPRDGRGRSGRVLVARDITDRIAQDERQIHQERLSVLGEVAAVMAHELNNPLAACSLFTQMLESDLEAESPLREHTSVIRRNVDACKRTIRELLDYATGATPEVASVDVNGVLEDVAGFLRPVRERAGVSMNLELGSEPVDVSGDEVQIRQVFVNLIVNAIQAMSARGGGSVTITSRSSGDWIEVDIADSGPGIPPETRDMVFKPFFTTKPRGEGTGLGLSTARRIAEMHGGGVELISTGPAGTVFRVRLRRRIGVAA